MGAAMADSEERKLDDVLQETGNLLGQVQAKNRACLYLLTEIVRDLARMTRTLRDTLQIRLRRLAFALIKARSKAKGIQ
jgi:hypothetical protein